MSSNIKFNNSHNKIGGNMIMNNLKKYFTIGTKEWKVTVIKCIKIGVILGLILGFLIIYY